MAAPAPEQPPKPTPPPPTGAFPATPRPEAGRVVAEKASWLKDEFGRVREAFDRQTRWWKYRFWIVAGYVAIAVVSVVLWAPPLNTLRAQVHVQTDFAERPKVIILNTSGGAWTNVSVRIEGADGRATQFQKSSVPANEDWSLPALEFNPKNIRISAVEGSYKVALVER